MTITTGRKDYKCDFCGKIISKGERHCVDSNKVKGHWKNTRLHFKCQKLYDNEMIDKTFDALEYSIKKNPQFYR